jgi:hypothetical protein
MRALILVVTLIAGSFLIPYAFRFSPSRFYLLFCLVVSLASWRPFHLYLLRHWKAHPERVRATRLNASHVVFQATCLSGGLFLLLCFVMGMLVTTMLGGLTIERGTVISSRWSRGCTKLTVETENAGFVKLCTRTPFGAGSAIAVRVRKSALGQYVE